LLVTEAMHGAVVADALRVPWIALRMYSKIDEFKWRDWCASLRLPYEPLTPRRLFDTPEERVSGWTPFAARAVRRARRPSFTLRLKRAAHNMEPSLSSDQVVESATDRMASEVERLRREHFG